MKLTIAKDQLLKGLQAVQNVVSTRTTLPVLSNILLKATDGKLEVIATDLDVTVTCTVEASVKKAGSTTLPAKKLVGIAREIDALEIDLEVDEKNICRIEGGVSHYRIHGLAAEDFPPLPSFSEKKKVVAPQAKIKSMLHRTSFAASTDETRYVLNGLFFAFKDHKITLVATDGRRLALVEDEADFASDSNAEFIVPSKTISELNRLLQAEGDVEIKVTDTQVAFVMDRGNGLQTVIISKLVEGSYPNYRQVIPSESEERIPLPREDFLAALRRAEIMTSDKANSVKLSFTKNNLTITANTPDIGEARESLAINYKGRDLAIAFNPVFLMDPLKVLDTDEVFFELKDDLSPGVVKINGPFLYVIMPMRMS